MQNKKETKGLCSTDRLCRLRMLRESMSAGSHSGCERHHGRGEHGKVRRPRPMCKRMPCERNRSQGGGNLKKHWYDYLWIFSLTYLVLGFFNILFAWLGLLCFFLPLLISLIKGTKGYCNRYCGRGQLFGLLGGRFGLSRKKDILDEEQGIPVWIFSILFDDVLSYALEYISGICRCAGSQTSGHAVVDFQSTVAMGLPWNAIS